MSTHTEQQSVDILDDLLGNLPTGQNQIKAAPAPSFSASTNAVAQAIPGVSPPVAQRGPVAPTLPSVVQRQTVAAISPTTALLDITEAATFEANLAKLLAKDLELAQHDRSMAIALFQVHLDRAEILDTMQLSMPVATVISDNTGATLKSLELAMKAGERVHKVAELLVTAQKNGELTALAAAKLKGAGTGDGGWGSEDDLP